MSNKINDDITLIPLNAEEKEELIKLGMTSVSSFLTKNGYETIRSHFPLQETISIYLAIQEKRLREMYSSASDLGTILGVASKRLAKELEAGCFAIESSDNNLRTLSKMGIILFHRPAGIMHGSSYYYWTVEEEHAVDAAVYGLPVYTEEEFLTYAKPRIQGVLEEEVKTAFENNECYLKDA